MGLTLGNALRILPRGRTASEEDRNSGTSVAFVGAGGKTTSLFALANEYPYSTIVTTTTHLGAWQFQAVDRHIIAVRPEDLAGLGDHKVTVVTGPAVADDRMVSVNPEVLRTLRRVALAQGRLLLIEADGARQRPLKAPGSDEPQIPPFTEHVVVVAGLGGIGRRLNYESVYHQDIFARLSGLGPEDVVTADALGQVLADTRGGLKGIPARARRIALLNQADTQELQAEAQRIANRLLGIYDAIVVVSMSTLRVHAAYEPCAAIVLAAGGAFRFGSPKQLLTWRGEPLIRSAARAALESGLSPVVVVTGAYAPQVASAVSDLPVEIASNELWQEGQSSSIRAGLDAAPPAVGSVIFLLADQPYVTSSLIQALVDAHASQPAVLVAPMVQGNRRGNPVLFDREAFAELRALHGDSGGRALFQKYPVHYVPWHDARIVTDIDTEEDYRRLMEDDQAW
jgi:molybdenum cofactor cytidylyltransferase